MKRAAYFVPLLFAAVVCAVAFADQVADRQSILATILALNNPIQRGKVFTKDADGVRELDRLLKSTPPTVTISHEPWGEAEIGIPFPTFPAVTVTAIRFLTPDVVLADCAGAFQYATAGPRTVPLLPVMKRESGVWKIVSLKVLAP